MRFSLRPLIARCALAIAFPLAATLGTLAVLTFTAAVTSSAAQAQQMPPGAKQPGDFPHTKLTAGMFVIDAAVAANDTDREQGLMYRTQLAPNEGMLFVFGENAVHCFWMKNTLIPLSIAFMRADGTITDIDEMQAETTNNHCPRNNGVYALEMSKGWFTAKGIKPGMKIDGLPPLQ
ncbi:hypothetical protein LMG28688_02247 [Paraburkholderia caffeinitolerans]|uniref:DUF192 domain-containing protein n=1 Tax=Paraburkholderia caffeinitolerans TaxID=1723730 RepID=A0A6J5FT78_9BURK|nr:MULTISPECIES: DUF192 domain-containing protein [Paraburkholderia]CAB3786334.1 hypothetical protein LMG28688_02247 [Paraburkholderia caffeinitolerans]